MGCSKQSLKRKVHTNKHIKNQERSQVNNLTLHFKEPEKEQQTDQSQEGNNRAEINDREQENRKLLNLNYK